MSELRHQMKFWDVASKAFHLQKETSVNSFCLSNDISLEEFDEIIQLMESMCLPLELRPIKGQLYICPKRFPRTLAKKFLDKAKIISSSLRLLVSKSSAKVFDKSTCLAQGEVPLIRQMIDQKAVELMKSAIDEQWKLALETDEGKKIKIIPLRMIYLEGELSLIAEAVKENHLHVLKLENISRLKLLSKNPHLVTHSPIEVDALISNIREVSSNEERLYLKISQDCEEDLSPPFHFFKSPYVTMNGEGDFIWAASVEVSPVFMEWLYSIKNNMEIMGPESFKIIFKNYCESKDGLAS